MRFRAGLAKRRLSMASPVFVKTNQPARVRVDADAHEPVIGLAINENVAVFANKGFLRRKHPFSGRFFVARPRLALRFLRFWEKKFISLWHGVFRPQHLYGRRDIFFDFSKGVHFFRVVDDPFYRWFSSRFWLTNSRRAGC